MKRSLWLTGLLTLAVMTGCNTGPQSSRGFRLPDGNAEKGRQAFLDLQCHTCHKVEGAEFPPPGAFNLTLGGTTTRVKTYGELVTSIINPSHVISPQYQAELAAAKISPMPEFNHLMTVEQMINLVTFLQTHYQIVEPEFVPPYHQ